VPDRARIHIAFVNCFASKQLRRHVADTDLVSSAGADIAASRFPTIRWAVG